MIMLRKHSALFLSGHLDDENVTDSFTHEFIHSLTPWVVLVRILEDAEQEMGRGRDPGNLQSTISCGILYSFSL